MNYRSCSDAYELCEEWEEGTCPINGLTVHSVDCLEHNFGQLILECSVGNLGKVLKVNLKVNLHEELFVLVQDGPQTKLESFFKGRRPGMRGAVVPASERSLRRIRRPQEDLERFVALLESAVFAIQVAASGS